MKNKSIFFAVLGIIVTIFIVSNSLKTASESLAMSSPFVDFLFEKLSLIFKNITRHDVTTFVRKAAHMAEFFVQGLFVSLAYFFGKSTFRKSAINVAFLGLLTACTDELVQNFVSGRGSLVVDIWIDFIGVILAIAIFFVLCFFSKRKKL